MVPKLIRVISFNVYFIVVVIQLVSHVRLCDPMNSSTPGVLHYLPEFAQTQVS